MREILQRGICSVCSANAFVLEAALEKGSEDGRCVLIESTSNQVNQFGGYTGMTPAYFANDVNAKAVEAGLPDTRLILGGDHIGPYPWRGEPADSAMKKGSDLVRHCIRAGYRKIHLDASMPLGNDQTRRHEPLDPELAAERTALLCKAAEDAAREAGLTGDSGSDRPNAAPVYVIGTEVPVPGGAEEDEEAPRVTPSAEFHKTVETTRSAFIALGLEAAWQRVVAVVVQPGVEFSDSYVHPYDSAQARDLCAALRDYPGLVFEGHSTDYQSARHLSEMVRDGITILKVGPALTFALREAIFLLSYAEDEMHASGHLKARSSIRETLDRVMVEKPDNWRDYYSGSTEELRFKRYYSLSDRIRYYWNEGEVRTSTDRLLQNLQETPIPRVLLSQFFPDVSGPDEDAGRIDPENLIKKRIREVLSDYP